MGRPVSTKRAGRESCPHCGHDLVYRYSAGGHLSYRCDECEASGFLTKDGKAYAERVAVFGAAETPAPDTPPPENAPKRVASVFDLGSL